MTFEDIAKAFGLSAEQLSALASVSMDLTAIAATAKKDEDRMALFVMAAAKKEAQYAVQVALMVESGNLNGARDLAIEARVFSKQAADLVRGWLETAANTWTKVSIARLFGWDPFKDMRQKTRDFAKKWDLDPSFRTAMG